MGTTDGEIDPRWDDPSNYGQRRAHDADGRYPPDWDARRQAVMDEQNYWCGRCGRYAGDVASFQVHHLQFLSEGGGNELENLVGLCRDCHALMHPDNDEMAGDWTDAPMFPDADGDPRVAVIRRPTTEGEYLDAGQHLAALETVARPPTVNRRACSDACYALSTDDTRRAVASFAETVAEYDLSIPDGKRAVHLRVVDDTGPTAGVDAAIETPTGTKSRTVDERGHVTFHVPDHREAVTVWVGGEQYQSETVELTFSDSAVERVSETVRLSPERETEPVAPSEPSTEPSTAELVGSFVVVLLAAYGGWEYMGLDGAFGAAIGVLLLLGAIAADAE